MTLSNWPELYQHNRPFGIWIALLNESIGGWCNVFTIIQLHSRWHCHRCNGHKFMWLACRACVDRWLFMAARRQIPGTSSQTGNWVPHQCCVAGHFEPIRIPLVHHRVSCKWVYGCLVYCDALLNEEEVDYRSLTWQYVMRQRTLFSYIYIEKNAPKKNPFNLVLCLLRHVQKRWCHRIKT